MAVGFEIFKADGSLQISSNDIGGLYLDTLSVGVNGSLSKTYAGLAGVSIEELVNKSNGNRGGVTLSKSVSGSDLVITLTASSGASADAEIVIE